MKYVLVAFVLVSCSSMNAQNKSDLNEYFKKNYSRLDLEYFIFYEGELVSCMLDTAYRTKFKNDLKNQIKRIQTSSKEESREREVFLNILYRRIEATKTQDKESMDSRSFLLNQLREFKKLDFVPDFQSLENRLDPKKRGLPFGDEECSLDFSLFIFFIYNPELYIKVVTESKIINPSNKKILFPTKCFLEELSPVSLAVKERTRQELLAILDKYKGAGYDAIRSKIQKADLNAKFD
jgi:hypothetical protein